jgi:hypothetical protein
LFIQNTRTLEAISGGMLSRNNRLDAGDREEAGRRHFLDAAHPSAARWIAATVLRPHALARYLIVAPHWVTMSQKSSLTQLPYSVRQVLPLFRLRQLVLHRLQFLLHGLPAGRAFPPSVANMTQANAGVHRDSQRANESAAG